MASKSMIPSSEDKLARVAAGEQVEILKIVRLIRDELKLVPNKVVDEVADMLKAMDLGVGARATDSEGRSHDARMPVEPGNAEEAVMPSAATDAIDRASHELEDLNSRLQEKRTAMEELSHSFELRLKDVEGLESRKTGLEVEVADLESSLQKACSQLVELESKKASITEELGECRSLAEQADAIHSLEEERDLLIVKESELIGRCEELRKRNAVAQSLLDRLWPTWFKADAMAEWKAEIETGISSDSSPATGLLFAALHSFSAALHDEDPKTLHDSLRDVGRRLYAWLRDKGITDEDASTIAETWARSINQECLGRGEIEVPVPGHAANNQWMIFQPRGGSSPDVLSVRSWCVRDSLKRPVHRAEVTV
jgi:hypothetical protein